MRRSLTYACFVLVAGCSSSRSDADPNTTADTISRVALSDSAVHLKQLLGAIGYAYAKCPMLISTITSEEALRALEGRVDTSLAGTAAFIEKRQACPDSAAKEIDSLYALTRRDSLSPVVTTMTKEIMADWRANMSALQPKSLREVEGAFRSAYQARIDAMEHEFERKRERLKLELQ